MKIQFTKSPIGPLHLAYFIGDVVDLQQNQAESLIELGFATAYHQVISHVTDLPADMPHREKLLKAGVTTMEELKEYDDLTEIDGIGVKAAQAIDKYINS